MPTALRGANNIVEINIQVSGLLDQGGAHRPQGGGGNNIMEINIQVSGLLDQGGVNRPQGEGVGTTTS